MSEQRQAQNGVCPDEDALVELALGQSDRQARERITGHLALCAGCRRSYDELAGAVELVLPVVPRIAPPPAFEAAALARLDQARRGGAPVRRRTVLLAAAAAVLGVAAGAGATAYLSQDEPTSWWARPLLTADGATVGHVSPSYGEDGALLVIDVTTAPAGRRYTCRLRLLDGSSRDVGVWTMAADRPNSWAVQVDDPQGVRAVELVGPSGDVWSTARL